MHKPFNQRDNKKIDGEIQTQKGLFRNAVYGQYKRTKDGSVNNDQEFKL